MVEQASEYSISEEEGKKNKPFLALSFACEKIKASKKSFNCFSSGKRK